MSSSTAHHHNMSKYMWLAGSLNSKLKLKFGNQEKQFHPNAS